MKRHFQLSRRGRRLPPLLWPTTSARLANPRNVHTANRNDADEEVFAAAVAHDEGLPCVFLCRWCNLCCSVRAVPSSFPNVCLWSFHGTAESRSRIYRFAFESAFFPGFCLMSRSGRIIVIAAKVFATLCNYFHSHKIRISSQLDRKIIIIYSIAIIDEAGGGWWVENNV